MKLQSPRHDPYSTKSNALEKLDEKGYKERFSVVDENTIKDNNGQTAQAAELTIDEVIRIADRENKSDKTMLIALNTSKGSRGVLISKYGEGGDDIVNRFLQNVDKDDKTHKNY